MLSNTTQRADVTATSATTIQFAASGSLPTRPIRLWALSGRQAALTAHPTPLTISGTAGVRYLYAALATPSGNAYSTVPGGTLYRILNDPTTDEANWYNAFRAMHPGDGTLIDPAINSAVTFVETASATPPDAHHVSLGQFEVVGGSIASINSYEGQVQVNVGGSNHGQCELIQSGGNLVLRAKNGQALIIEGVTRAVDVAGISVAPTGLTVGWMYYIYAYWTGSAVALTAQPTPNVTHTNGVEIMSGDPTRTYVGKQLIAAGPIWSVNQPVQSRFHAAAPNVLIRATGNPLLTLASSTTETSIFPGTVPAIEGGVLGSDEFLELVVFGDFLNSVGTHGFDIRVYYGATMILSFVATTDYVANAGRRGWHVYGYLAAAGGPAAQTSRGHLVASTGTPGISGGTSDDGGNVVYHSTHMSIAVDSTVGQTFNVTVQNDFNAATTSLRVFSAILRRMRM